MDVYEVKPLRRERIEVSVPASKSILNRALLLAAFTEGDTILNGAVSFGQDTRDLLSCLSALGIAVGQEDDALLVHGTRKFAKRAVLNVGSAGTAARFLPAVLAAFGGEYTIDASDQMKRRPMEILSALECAGVQIERSGGSFPFRMRSSGLDGKQLTVGTDSSTQYASGLLLAAALGSPFTLRLTGDRTEGGYIATTISLLEAFGATVSSKVEGADRILTVSPAIGRAEYAVPADFSAACYFYALSLFGKTVLVRGAHSDCCQSDLKFLALLRERGVILSETAEGIRADGAHISGFDGFGLDMRDFSDQTLTLAALAPFAATPTRLTGIGHIRRQECDRIGAIAENLSALGVPCTTEEDAVSIRPAMPRSAREKVLIKTFSDHRVAMAFALVGLATGNVLIDDPGCCSKTFGDYFRILGELTAEA